MSEKLDNLKLVPEWSFHEDDLGIVYCVGRQNLPNQHEAVAVYEKSETGEKISLTNNQRYQRLMYHGLPEEDFKLNELRPEIKNKLLGNLSLKDYCLFVEPSYMTAVNMKFQSIETWLNNNNPATIPYRTAIERACSVLDPSTIAPETTSLYGGASCGLIGYDSKPVDDVDFLLDLDVATLQAQVLANVQHYSWTDINPRGILSKRAELLKAKRWATSQIRLNGPDFMSIDFKLRRDPTAVSHWEHLPESTEFRPFKGLLKVIDASEGFCTSPALACEGSDGNENIILLRGYTYIGCALEGDMITVSGKKDMNSGVVIVSNGIEDGITPDLRNAPIS